MKPCIEHLYVHIPFCTHICPYCAFYKHKNDLRTMTPFIHALKAELAWAREQFDLQPRTIYFGGGTPSALSLSQLEALFSDWPWKDVKEFSFECNPATVSEQKARLLRQIGVNRISLGVQSLQTEFLKLLGRTHTAQGVHQTIEHLRTAGFEDISLDLMYALPTQSLDAWRADLEAAVALSPTHLSAYNLNFEEDTPFFEQLARGAWHIDEAREREMFLATVQFLEERGFGLYEVSNFARAGYASTHNQAYWDGKDYLGLGPSACSTVGGLRWKNVPDSHRYIESMQVRGSSERSEEALSPSMRQGEKIMLALRTARGVPLDELTMYTFLTESLLHDGRARVEEGRFKLTREGLLVADSIAGLFV